MITRTEAVVLRSMKYGETSQIVTLFTRDLGKISVLAKGARLPKSKFGSTLQPMSYIQVIFYYRSSRSLQILSESAHLFLFHDIGRNLDKITTGLRIVELTNALMQEEEQNPAVFNLLLQVLFRLNDAQERFLNVLPYYQLKLSTILGFSPNIDREIVQSLPAEGGILALDSGAVLPGGAIVLSGRHASRAALRAFAIFARADLEVIIRMRVEQEDENEVLDLVEAYLRFHFQDAYPSRSSKVIDQFDENRFTPSI